MHRATFEQKLDRHLKANVDFLQELKTSAAHQRVCPATVPARQLSMKSFAVAAGSQPRKILASVRPEAVTVVSKLTNQKKIVTSNNSTAINEGAKKVGDEFQLFFLS